MGPVARASSSSFNAGGSSRADELPHAPNRFGNKPPGQTYPGVEPVVYDPDEVIVPPFLPDVPECRAELAQYYQSISRVDQGLGRLFEILKQTGQWDNTLVIFISDHGIAFPGAKTTVYEPGLRSPCIVRGPRVDSRGVVSDAMISWVDITPTILDFAGAKPPAEPALHGRSFMPVLEQKDAGQKDVEQNDADGWDEIYASHTFHEITMYYPMRVVRGRRYKLIWNLAHPLPFPFASDLWVAPTWQAQYQQGPQASYGAKTVGNYLHRPQFELYDLKADPHEGHNLAGDPQHAELLERLKDELRNFQVRTADPWKLKWKYKLKPYITQ